MEMSRAIAKATARVMRRRSILNFAALGNGATALGTPAGTRGSTRDGSADRPTDTLREHAEGRSRPRALICHASQLYPVYGTLLLRIEMKLIGWRSHLPPWLLRRIGGERVAAARTEIGVTSPIACCARYWPWGSTRELTQMAKKWATVAEQSIFCLNFGRISSAASRGGANL